MANKDTFWKTCHNLATATLLLGAARVWGDDVSTRCHPPQGTSAFEFTSAGNTLRGFVDVPATPGKHPIVIIIHGSGGTDVMHGDGLYSGSYERLRATLRSTGIASAVWDKAGNGCSDGHYFHPDDVYARADEALAAIASLKQREDIDTSRIGAWAISQGGWVAPIAAARSRDIKFLILVSAPARDFYSVWAYQALQRLRSEGITEKEAQAAILRMRRSLMMMEAGATLEEFSAEVQPLLKYSVFAEQIGGPNGKAEAYAARTPQLLRLWATSTDRFLSVLDIPVLALFGDHDDLVDWRESVAVYREAFQRTDNRDVTIKVFKNADHGLVTMHSQNSSKPEFAAGYLDGISAWLRKEQFAGTK